MNTIGNAISPELVAYNGITTAAGNIGGTTLVDTNINPVQAGKVIVILSGSRTGELDNVSTVIGGTITIGTGGTQIPAGVRYCILNQLGAVAVVSSIAANVSTILAAVTSATYGNAALETILTSATYGLSAIETILTNATYGLSALDTEVESSSIATGGGSVATHTPLGSLVRFIADAINNVTYGLSAIKTAIGNISVPANLTALVTIPQAAVYIEEFGVSGSASSITIGTCTIAGIPSGLVAKHLFVHFLFSDRVDTSGSANNLAGAQNLQVQDTTQSGAFVTAFAFSGGEYPTASSAQMGGDAKRGTVDLISSIVPVNGDVLTIQWTSAQAAGTSLEFFGFECIVELQVG
jgi:hypothetical protein